MKNLMETIYKKHNTLTMNSMSKSATDTTIEQCDKYYDKEYTKILIENVFSKISKIYFRPKFIGFESLPKRSKNGKPLIFISNHSGMAFSWDSIVFTTTSIKMNDYNFDKSMRVLADPMLSQKKLMTPFIIDNFWKKIGCIDASFKNFEAMMKNGDTNLMIYPEGNDGLSKGFNKKYQIQKFSNTFLLMSLRHKADIAIYYTINAEYNNPNSYSFKTINKAVNKIGMPFLPIGLSTLLLIFQPWLYYFSFPSNLTYVFDKIISPFETIDKDPKLLTKSELDSLSEDIRLKMQTELDKVVEKHGKSPYNFKGLVKAFVANGKESLSILPFLWGFRFSEHDRLYSIDPTLTKKMENGNRILLSVIMNFWKLLFFIPIIGWIPILFLGLKNQKK